MKWTSYLIYGYREILSGITALVQRNKLSFDDAVFGLTDDAGLEATVVTLASGVSAIPTPSAPVNQVLQNYTAGVPSWGADIRHGTSPATSGAIRLTAGDEIRGAGNLTVASDGGALALVATDSLTASIGATALLEVVSADGVLYHRSHMYDATIAPAGDYQLLNTDRMVVFSSMAGTVTLPASPQSGWYCEVINTTEGAITIGAGAHTVNGSNEDQLTQEGSCRVWIYYDGTEFWVHEAARTEAAPS